MENWVNYKRMFVLGATTAAALAVPALSASAAQASSSNLTVYVSAHGTASARDANCGSGETVPVAQG
jgi:hypothetical protein